MPKVKASKNRVHHKAVGNKDTAKAVASFEAQQQLRELGLELTADKKEDKRKQRHDKWISKLEATYNPQKKKKKRSAKDQTLSVDFGSFHDVLSNLDPSQPRPPAASLKSGSGSKSKGSKGTPKASGVPTTPSVDHQQFTIHSDSSKPLQSKKAKKKAAMQEILRFQNVLAHPAFKSNPLLTIQQHVKNTMEMAPSEPSEDAVTTGPELMED
ncbi:MAG: ribosome biogenesis protein SLX9-domain-containing protein [Benniella sp.]|nr:MAG: ribosome biogenesis protein SLX9-domain-containing protein [Benniella sp.]